MRKGQINLIVCFLATIVLPSSFGLIEEIQTPRDILECLIYKSQNSTIGEVSGRTIQDFCIRKYTLDTQSSKENFAKNISAEGVQYLKSLFRQLDSEVHDQTRGKRQAATWRVRREIRTLSDAERNNVFQCFRRLKGDYSIDPRMSTYDLIASLHSGQAARMMHNGPAFLPRHMVYLLVMETACRVPMPYWDMTTDSEMMDPTTSIVWSDLFFGPGNGPVLSGPFGRFRTPTGTPIIRNIGSGGASLARKAGIRAMLSRRRMFEITEPQPAQSIFSVEVHHNGVHNYIDGYMAGLNTASWDPVFWFIHSFFQLLWVAFRNGQRASGINPERDYPRGMRVPPGHEFYQRMNFMPFMRRISNLEGCSNRYDRIVQYTPMPRCPACGGSPFLVCLRGVCVSRSSRRAPAFFRGKRSVGNPEDQLADENVNPNTTNLIQSNEAALSTLNKPYQNTFMIDGKIDEDAWAYIPIRVLYERPKGFNFHTTSPGAATKRDMYDPENFKTEAKRIGLHNEVQYKQQCTPSGSGAAKVFVQSNGLNYAGKYKDYAIVDERQPVTSAITYIGFKKPSGTDSEVILTAYDTCGRICRPACPVHGHHRESYKACSGSFRISSKSPLMFSQNYGSAVSSTWNVREMEPGCQSSKSLPITFVCDHQNSWPWESKL